MVYSRTLTGKIRYACPGCGEVLLNRLCEAGDQDSCPQCGTTYTVPGIDEKNASDAKRRAKAASKEARAEVNRKRFEESKKRVAAYRKAPRRQLDEEWQKNRATRGRRKGSMGDVVIAMVFSLICAVIGLLNMLDSIQCETVFQQLYFALLTICWWIPATGFFLAAVIIGYRE